MHSSYVYMYNNIQYKSPNSNYWEPDKFINNVFSLNFCKVKEESKGEEKTKEVTSRLNSQPSIWTMLLSIRILLMWKILDQSSPISLWNSLPTQSNFQIWEISNLGRLVLFCHLSSSFWILLFPKIHHSSFSNTSRSLCVMIQGTKVEDFKCLMASREWLATLPTCDVTCEKHC